MHTNKPGNLEIKLFRYLCSQADYGTSKISAAYKGYYIQINFKKQILDHIREFTRINGMQYSDVIDVANRWLRRYKGNIVQHETKIKVLPYSKKEVSYPEYYFSIFSSHDGVYFNHIPRRTLRKIVENSACIKMEDVEFKPNITKPKFNPEEKRFFRYVCYNAIIDKCQFRKKGDTYTLFKIVIPNINELAKAFLNDDRCHITNNFMRKILHKWKSSKGFAVRTDDENTLLILQNRPDIEKYFNAIPHNIKTKIIENSSNN